MQNIEIRSEYLPPVIWKTLMPLASSWRHYLWIPVFDCENGKHFQKGKVHDQAKDDSSNDMKSFDFHIVNAFPKRQIFNASYYIKHILQSILELRPEPSGRHFVIHMDNARLHVSRKFQMFCKVSFLRIALHSPCPELDSIIYLSFRLYRISYKFP
jgi:hypothetical protein